MVNYNAVISTLGNLISKIELSARTSSTLPKNIQDRGE